MKSLFLACVFAVLCCCARAVASSPAEITSEGRSYFAPCEFPGGSHDNAACDIRQKAFLNAYVRAYAGNGSSQRDVAFMFIDGKYGVHRDPIQSCAWHLVNALQDLAHIDLDKVEEARSLCQPAGAVGFELAKLRAQQIIAAMAAAGAIPHDDGLAEDD